MSRTPEWSVVKAALVEQIRLAQEANENLDAPIKYIRYNQSAIDVCRKLLALEEGDVDIVKRKRVDPAAT